MTRRATVESEKTISELIEYIKNTKGAGAAGTFYSQHVKPFLKSIDETYSLEMMQKLEEETKCINPNCATKHNLTFHHFFPKVYRHDYAKKKPVPNRQGGTLICRPCHTVFHNAKTAKQIVDGYTTEETIIKFFLEELPNLNIEQKVIGIKKEETPDPLLRKY